MKTTIMTFAAAATLALTAGGAFAQDAMDHGKMGKMAMGGGSHMDMADKDFMSAMQKMHKEMMTAKGRDVDTTFARKMIQHHQGAIAMSRIELEHGSDAQAKQVAQKTIDENTKGIAELQAWLRQHGG